MYLQNFHTHTTFSDARDPAEEVVLSAIERGFTAIGFSDHGCASYDGAAMKLENEPKYRAEIRRLKEKYEDKIEIVLGVEHDAVSNEFDLANYDYFIDSVHYLHKNGEYAPIDWDEQRLAGAVERLYGGDWYAMTKDYYRCVCETYAKNGAQIAGHIDLVMKYNEDGHLYDFNDKRYLDCAMEAVHAANDYGLIVEINTGAIARGSRTTPYPMMPLLKELRRIGGRIIITADSHRADTINCAFDKAEAWAKEAGFEHICVWKNGRFV